MTRCDCREQPSILNSPSIQAQLRLGLVLSLPRPDGGKGAVGGWRSPDFQLTVGKGMSVDGDLRTSRLSLRRAEMPVTFAARASPKVHNV